MRSIQVTTLDGPTGVGVHDVPEPEPAPGQAVVEVAAIGLSWPDLLLTRGQYQIRPDLPFQLGVDFAGTVRSAPDGSGVAAGDRVAGVMGYGAGGEVLAVGPGGLFRLPDGLSFESAAAVGMNYLTVEFALGARGGLAAGETVLIHGAAGGVGTAGIQVAKALGARVFAVVSSPTKAAVARTAGADEILDPEGFLAQARELTGGVGVDLILDPVGGDRFTDSLRALAPLGRLLVVGFTGGSIPEVKVNRLLLNNIDVRGVGWGAYAMGRNGFFRRQWEALLPMIRSGAIDPPIGARYPVEQIAEALDDMDQRRTLGKTVLVF